MKLLLKPVFILSMILYGCEEQDVSVRDYPRLKTLAVSNINEDGATFNAEITFRGNFEIISYGFFWNTEENSSIGNSERIEESGDLKTRDFSLVATSAFLENEKYYVKSFVKTADFTVYGEELTFMSLGSKAPSIKSISPKSVFYGDTVEISGENFSYQDASNNIKFGKVTVGSSISTDSLIKVVVPDSLKSTEFIVSISILGNKTESNETLKFIPPKINGISKTQVVFGDTLDIIGSHFGYKRELNTVKVNDEEVLAFFTDSTKIKIVIPVVQEPNVISVTNSLGQSSVFEESITILRPELTRLFPAEGFWKDKIEIIGDNFGHIKGASEVYFNNKEAKILDFSNKQLIVEVPEEVVNPVEVKILGGNQESNKKDFLFVDMVINSINPAQGGWGDIVTLSGENLTSNSEGSIVQVDGLDAEIISQNQNEISFNIPVDVNSKNASIRIIRNDGREKETTSPFILNDPQISSLSAVSFDFSKTLTIDGVNFHPRADRNIVTFKNSRLDVVAASSNSLDVKFPLSLISNQLISESLEGEVTVSTGVGIATSEVIQVDHTGPWTNLSFGPEFDRNLSLANLKTEIFAYDGDSIFIFNTTNDTWSFETLPPTSFQRYSPLIFVESGYLFLGLGRNFSEEGGVITDLKDLWKYDFSSKTWSELGVSPFLKGMNSLKFDFQNSSYILNNDFLGKYNSSLDQWELIKEFDFQDEYTTIHSVLIRNENINFLASDLNNCQSCAARKGYLYEYNIESNELTVDYSLSFLHVFSPIKAFYNNQGLRFFSSRRLFTSEWGGALINWRPPFSINNYNSSVNSSIEVDGNYYFGLNNGSFWSFDPSK